MIKKYEGAYLIYGGTKRQRQDYIEGVLRDLELTTTRTQPDLLKVGDHSDDKALGIDVAKQVVKFSTQKPFAAQFRCVVIYKSSTMTVPAQNALLKTLEEPYSYMIFLLETESTRQILPTILSRCQKVGLKNSGGELSARSKSILYELVARPIGERLDAIDRLYTLEKEDLVADLTTCLVSLVADATKVASLKADATGKTGERAKLVDQIAKLEQVIADLKQTNVNPKLAVDYLVVGL